MALWFFFPLIFLFFYFFFFKRLKPRRNLPPSPPSLPIIGHLHLLKKPLHHALAAISASYGPLVFLRFGSRPVLVVSSPSALEDCFTKNDVIFANRPRLLAGKHLGYNYTTLGWASYGPHWRNIRRITMIEVFSTKCINMFSGIRREELRSLFGRLFSRSVGAKGADQVAFFEVNMKEALFELVYNIASRVTLGRRYYGESLEETIEAKWFKEIVEESFYLGGASNLGDFLPLLGLMDLLGLEKRLAGLHRKRDKFLQGMIDERRMGGHSFDAEGKKKKKTLMDVLLSLQQSDPSYYTDDVVKATMVMMFTAGTDTTSSTMEWAMSLLLNHPDELNRARAELDIHVGDERLIQESDLPNLPHLHNIINETLRLYPAAPLLVPHESSEVCSVEGYDVPRGTMLLASVWAMHRDPKAWPDPMRFAPERFEGGDREKKMAPFGMGRRRCPGENMALRVMELVLGGLIQCFEWRRIGEAVVDMSEGVGLTLPKAEPLIALCRPRQTMTSLLSQL